MTTADELHEHSVSDSSNKHELQQQSRDIYNRLKTLTLKHFESVHLNNVNHGDVAEPAEQPVCDQNCTSASHVTPEAAGTRHSEDRQLLLAASKNKMLTTNRLFLLLQ